MTEHDEATMQRAREIWQVLRSAVTPTFFWQDEENWIKATAIERGAEKGEQLEGQPIEWQPIESALRDRTIVLLGETGTAFSPCSYQEAGVISEDAFWLWWQADYNFVEVKNPTHWMPLPPAPEQSP